MLYYLFRYLENEFDFPGAGLFEYISFRAAVTLILSLFFSMIIGRRIIEALRRKQIGETIRTLGLAGEQGKKGTPTMGGIIIILSIIVPVLLMGRLRNIYLLLMIFTTLWLGALGFADDYIKVIKKNKNGLPGKAKIVGQVILGMVVGLTIYLSPETVVVEQLTGESKAIAMESIEAGEKTEAVKSTATTIPFVNSINFEYSDLVPFLGEHAEAGGWILFVLVVIFIITATSNGANLTDGLDGLAAGTSAGIGVGLAALAYVSSNIFFASYLDIMYIPGTEELVVYAAAFCGAMVGFLWYNAHPAQVFMGDTGSLTIGGIIAVFCVIVRKELLIPILCGIFLVESISVILQVSYFKLTKKHYGEGRRLFLMTPIHHHYQKKGVAEEKIVTRFWIVSLALVIFTLLTLKIR